jgi:Asp-tRNA(Asn)/Glu-tRNA(Gln) amidotransferase A subunit family amidase
MSLHAMSGIELADAIREGAVSPVEAVEAHLDRAREDAGDVNAFTHVREDALAEAREAERALDGGDEGGDGAVGPLHGVPVALKDLGGYKAGVPCTRGSIPFADFVPEYTVPTVERLEAAGAVVLGMTNVCEFGHKGATDNALFGPTGSPFDPERNAGGSSGGATAAVGAGQVPLAQGADGGGSVRIPAAWSGVVGVKPTYGRTPLDVRPNKFATHTPYIHHGPQTRTVADAALALDVMCGPHDRDPHSLPDDGTDYRGAVGKPVDDLKVAYSPDLGTFPVAESVRETCAEAVDALREAGATVERVDPDFGGVDHREITDAWLTWTAVKYATTVRALYEEEGLDLLARREDLTPEMAAAIDRGRDVSAVAYRRTDATRSAVYSGTRRLFEEYDLLASATVGCLPVENGNGPGGRTLGPAEIAGEAVERTIGWCLTHPFNMTGQPAASVPAGFVDGLPVGLQIAGPRFAEGDVLGACAALEAVRPWIEAYPFR